LIVAAGLSLFLLVLRDRAAIKARRPVERPASDSPRLRHVLRAVQFVVPVVLLLWLFIAPMTDDDGYYAAMARNSPLEGYVGNYYQLLNQSFTPFTWFYRVLGYWDSLVGSSQVLLRVPALLAGLLTWTLLQRFIGRTQLIATSICSNKYAEITVSVTLAVTFLAWWLPYDMGVRPEGIVALLSAGVLVVVQSAIRTQSLAFVALGLLLAGLSVVCHPTGFIALAPLVAGLPSMWPVIRGEDRRSTAHNVLAVIAPAGLVSAVAFGDGSLRDFIHGQEIFLSRFAQSTWYEEYNRYGLLLNSIPMGSYAKRAAVLLGLICLLWFAVLVAAGRGRGLRLNSAFLLTGYSLALALIFLWLTPSKWTHHFGSLAALGPAFLTMFLLSAPAIASRFTGLKRIARPVTLAIAFSAIVVFVLSFRGPNSWPYSWMLGMTHADLPPGVGPVTFASLPLWAGGYGLVAAVLVWWARRRNLSWRPIGSLITASTMAVLFLTLSTGYLLASFGLATVKTWDTYSPMAGNLQDPLATECDAAGAIDVLADSTAQPLPGAAQESPAGQENTGSPFIEGGGFFPAAPPPGGIGSPAASRVWGSLAGPQEEEATGDYASPWFALPRDLDGDKAVGILAAGRLDGGNSLVVEYARLSSGRPYVVDRQELTDSIDSPVWRSIALDVEDHIGADGRVLRVVATDATVDTGGWLAFTAPSVQSEIELQDYIPMDAAVGVSWQFSFLFPCQRLPTVQNGITEPIEYGVVYGTEGTNGLDDNTWTIYAGGLFGPVSRVAGIVQLPAQLRDAPDISTLQVYRFDNPYPSQAYELRAGTRTLLGWEQPSW
ncbi:MAG: arabinosyltransferase, partial [Actinomycetota bacterium]|nr:arabinosyltransferase [Actinomycetota bacterium]